MSAATAAARAVCYLPPGRKQPETNVLDAFWSRAQARLGGLPDRYQVRSIGFDVPTTMQVLGLIRRGEKTGTFGLPWIYERLGEPRSRRGEVLVLCDFEGVPRQLVRVTEVRDFLFGRVTAADIAIDGPAVRELAVWVPMHTQHWNAMLQPHGLAVCDDMPCWAQPFELLYED